jgi:hypothetical protein
MQAAEDEKQQVFHLSYIEKQVRTASGAVPRWHCKKCKKFVTPGTLKNHARLCSQGSKLNAKINIMF